KTDPQPPSPNPLNQRPPTPTTTPAPAAQSAPSPPSASISGDGAAKPAEESDKESEATSLEQTIELRPGRPAASQGLEIFTRRPNFTGLTIVTANPKNPLVKVVFGSSGDVVDVEILESSGARDIDEPVVNAVFLWTAKGPALKRIRSDSPTAGLSVKIRILLR
ncbi:MAG: energy transducer TonB, partial [Phycisphaerales bacterium]|nr:energy transducer TonB [Phycisphaerales bacterium]